MKLFLARWDRLHAILPALFAGYLAAKNPSESIDKLYGGLPLTGTLGAWLFVAAALRLYGVCSKKLVPQRVGLIAMLVPLYLYFLVLVFISAQGAAYGLLLLAFAGECVTRYKTLTEMERANRAVTRLRQKVSS